MTKEQIQRIIKDHPNAINLIPSSHLGDLPDLVEAHAEVFTLTRSECVKNYDKDGSSWMPSAVAISRLATAAGINFYDLGDNTRKEGQRCWVGKCQAYRMGPDGKNEDGPACEKEFDADLQIEAMGLRGRTVWNEVNGKNVKSSVPYEQKELNAQLAQFIVTGRERANTGAKTRAVMQLLGQPRAFKGIFSEKGNDNDSREFLVSRIIWNTKNKMLMERMLDNLAGNTAKLYGPQKAREIQAPEAMKPAAPLSPDDDDDIPMGEPAQAPSDPRLSSVIASLSEWSASDTIPAPVAQALQAVIDRGESRLEFLEPLLEVVRLLGERKIGQRMAAAAEATLVMPNLDTIILADLITKARANAKKMAEAGAK